MFHCSCNCFFSFQLLELQVRCLFRDKVKNNLMRIKISFWLLHYSFWRLTGWTASQYDFRPPLRNGFFLVLSMAICLQILLSFCDEGQLDFYFNMILIYAPSHKFSEVRVPLDWLTHQSQEQFSDSLHCCLSMLSTRCPTVSQDVCMYLLTWNQFSYHFWLIFSCCKRSSFSFMWLPFTNANKFPFL